MRTSKERARLRYLGVSLDAPALDETPADAEATVSEDVAPAAATPAPAFAAAALEVEIDAESSAAVRDFPSSDATVLLIVVVKELVDVAHGHVRDSSFEDDPNALTKTGSSIPQLDESQENGGHVNGESQAMESSTKIIISKGRQSYLDSKAPDQRDTTHATTGKPTEKNRQMSTPSSTSCSRCRRCNASMAARRASAKNAGDRSYASMTEQAASSRPLMVRSRVAWSRASLYPARSTTGGKQRRAQTP